MLKHSFGWLVAGSILFTNALLPAGSLAADSSAKRPHMDLAFCIDTTGSMSGEIEMVKQKTKEIVAKLASGKPAPVIRVGLVAYRDRGDQYVTKLFPFTDDIDKIVKDISGLQAAGGGDTPESVNEALHVAVNDLGWDKDKHTAKLLFLIGDAAPHQYPNDYNWKDESKKAISSGIQINTLACGGLEGQADGMEAFREIAKLSDGKFATLAYRQEIATKDGRKETVISSAGAAYKLKSADAADWKASVASGKMVRMAAEAPASPSSTVTGLLTSRRAGSVAAFAAAAPMARAEAGGMAGMADRKDSNLDDIVLSVARDKAAKSLKIDYSK